MICVSCWFVHCLWEIYKNCQKSHRALWVDRCLPARFITAILEHHPKTFTRINIFFWEAVEDTSFFLYSFQQHLPCWCYTTSDSRETVWKHWGEDRFHRIKTSDEPGTVILLCKSIFTTTWHFLSASPEKKLPKRLVEHLVELKCNIAFNEFQRDKKRSTYNCVTRC